MSSLPSEINRDKFIELTHKHTNTELSKIFNRSPRTIRRYKAHLRKKGMLHGEGGFPISEAPVYNSYPKLNLDKFLVISDIEFPEHDAEILAFVVDIARRFGIKDLIVNGDFIALDSFSRWARESAYRIAFKQELNPMVESLKILLKTFDHITWVTGNHERRLAYRVDGEITIKDFLTGLSNCEFSEYAFCEVTSKGREYFVCHQDNYSKIPLSVPREMAAIKHKNIICAHSHHLAQSYDRSGKYFILEGGSGRDPQRTRYKATRANLFPQWVLGFVMVYDGVPFLIDKNNIDFWLRVKLED
jgi:predicted phosphodiesterase